MNFFKLDFELYHWTLNYITGIAILIDFYVTRLFWRIFYCPYLAYCLCFFGKKDQYWLFWQRHCCYFHFTLITDNIWQSRRGFTRFFFLLSFQKSAAAQRTESVVQCTLQFNEKNSRSVSIVVLQIPCHPLGFDEIFSISFFNWCNIIVPIIFSEFSIQWCFHEIFCCSQVATTTKTTLPFFTITDESLIANGGAAVAPAAS